MKQETRNKKQETSSTPLISVIVPVYNAEKTLRQCVDSILGQDYMDFELLLIDDGSMDNSPAICDDYAVKDLRVKVFHKLNGGVSSARNLGLDNALGEWITFVDSDDMVSKDYLNKVVDCSENLIVVGYWNLSPDGTRFGSKHIPSQNETPIVSDYLSSKLASFEMRGPYCKFYRRGLLKGISFHEDMKVAEDVCFVMDYLRNVKTLRILPESYYIFRCHELEAVDRYKTTVDYAINSLCHLKYSYNELVDIHHLSKKGFMSYIAFFKASSKNDWENNPFKWYGNNEIREFYKYVWHDLSLRQKMMMLGSFILKK